MALAGLAFDGLPRVRDVGGGDRLGPRRILRGGASEGDRRLLHITAFTAGLRVQVPREFPLGGWAPMALDIPWCLGETIDAGPSLSACRRPLCPRHPRHLSGTGF